LFIALGEPRREDGAISKTESVTFNKAKSMKHSRDVVGLQRFKYGTGAFMNKHSGIYLLVQFRRRCRPRKPVSCLALLFIHAGCAAATANTLLLSGCRR
jgi:hypothetical protein